MFVIGLIAYCIFSKDATCNYVHIDIIDVILMTKINVHGHAGMWNNLSGQLAIPVATLISCLN